MELPRSVRWYRERSIIIAIACNEAGQTATKTGNILRGDGENTSGLERRRGRGGEGRGGGRGSELARAKSTRASLTLTFTRARACVYMQTRHMGRRDDRQSGRPTKKKKSGKDEPRVANRREKTYERKDGPRRRNRGVRTSDSNYLELQANDPTIHRHIAPPTTVTFVPRRL